ncbi:hypothetical protein NEF87_002840 [Candidatus Lokiarchaeum ossiferum]|uniref:Uncharacterized protein n=1 Tax=Candidatus Lokiarchaeum ossiferum TaxID=2951803 RepID=A0ABY6HSR7_9ARCH|nr:hypothetical protein NEF87_002840 [Candidatus Lokiarchaeum sp. B-35]
MALTTSDELQKQLAVIFGFKGQLELEVGEIVGIGSLSKKTTEYLIKNVLNYLNAYNSMLRDYANCQLHSIEFSLDNLGDPNDIQLMPKSMLFIPGEYKDCNTLLLLLAPEASLLNPKTAKSAVDNLGKLYFEVEEALSRNEITKEQKQEVLTKFARRFALKLQGNVIEGKWNRKLVGLKTNSDDVSYLSVNIQKEYLWENKEIIPKNHRFRIIRTPLDENDQFDFLKYKLSQSTVFVITKNTFHLTSNLLHIANTGTINDLHRALLILLLKNFIVFFPGQEDYISFDQFKDSLLNFIAFIDSIKKDFFILSDNVVKSGIQMEFKNLPQTIISEFQIEQDGSLRNQFYTDLQDCFINYIIENRQDYQNSKNFRAFELKTPFLFMQESLDLVLNKIKIALPGYFTHELLTNHAQTFIELLQKEFDSIGKKPIIALGLKYLEKYSKYIQNQIDNKYLESIVRNESQVQSFFNKIAKESIEPFISGVSIETEDLLSLCGFILADIPVAIHHIEILMKYRVEIEFLWGLVLRASTLQRFIKEYPTELTFDPQTFCTQFIEFLQRKRLGGFQLVWKNEIFAYIQEFANQYQSKYLLEREQKIYWSKQKIVSLFIDYLGKKVDESTTLEGFLVPLKKYLDNIAMKNVNNRIVLKIVDLYSEGLEVFSQFPDYMRQVFYKTLENYEDIKIHLQASTFIGPLKSIDDAFTEDIEFSSSLSYKKSFFNYIIEHEMKYFSKLFAEPKNIILKSLENETFDGKVLYHHINFQSLGDNFSKLMISSNYQSVKPRFKRM